MRENWRGSASSGMPPLRRRRQNPLLRRIVPLFRPQWSFPINSLSLQAFWPREAQRRRLVWQNPLFLPLLPANPAGGSVDSTKIHPALARLAFAHPDGRVIHASATRASPRRLRPAPVPEAQGAALRALGIVNIHHKYLWRLFTSAALRKERRSVVGLSGPSRHRAHDSDAAKRLRNSQGPGESVEISRG
jgi:hypothetical protein